MANTFPPLKNDKKAFKVRKGKIGEYRKLLKPETVKYIDNRIIKDLHHSYGYI